MGILNFNSLESEFKKYLKIVDEKETFRWAEIKPLTREEIAEYGDLAISAISFGWFKVIKYKHKYQLVSFLTDEPQFRDGFNYEIYELIQDFGDRDTPPSEDERFILENEHGVKAFVELMSYIMAELIDNAIMADSMLSDDLRKDINSLSPFLVNLTGDLQFLCEAENEEHAKIQAINTYPDSNIIEVKKQGEE